LLELELEVPLCCGKLLEPLLLPLLLLLGEVELPELLLPEPVLLLPGELRLPPDPSLPLLVPIPPGEVAPPVEDVDEVPK
jgi:hypothetical protein